MRNSHFPSEAVDMAKIRTCKACNTPAVRPPDGNYSKLVCLWCGGKSFLIEGQAKDAKRVSFNEETPNSANINGIVKKPIPKYSRYRYCSNCGSRDLYGDSTECRSCGSNAFEVPLSPDRNPDHYLRKEESESTGTKISAGFGILVIFSIWLAFFGFISFVAYYLLKDLNLNFEVKDGIPPYFIFLPFLGAIIVLLSNQKK